MQSLIQSDIFFFITSIAVIAVTVLTIIALIYVIQILRDVKIVSGVVKKKAFFLALETATIKRWIKKIIEFFGTTRRKKKSVEKGSK